MLSTLLMVVFTQLPMQGISENTLNIRAIAQPEVVVKTVEIPVVKTVEVVKKIYVYTDKFGVEHEGANKAAVYNEVYLENQKPFQMKDVEGRIWQHQDKAVLEKWINDRNYVIQMNKNIGPQAFIPLNCTPVA